MTNAKHIKDGPRCSILHLKKVMCALQIYHEGKGKQRVHRIKKHLKFKNAPESAWLRMENTDKH